MLGTDADKAAHKPTARSQVTNRWPALPGDGRGRWHRRRIDLIKELTSDVGRTLNARDRALVSNVAAMQCRLEQLQADVANGVNVDMDALVRGANALQRMLTGLGIPASAKPNTPDLAAYLRSKAAA